MGIRRGRGRPKGSVGWRKKAGRRVSAFRKHTSRGMSRPNSTLRMAKLGTGIPDKMMVRMRYVDSQTLNLSSSANTTYQYRLTSLYYPNYTGGTDHFPMTFNNYAPLYDRYVVIGAKFNVRYMIPSASTFATDVAVGFYFQDNPASIYPANLQALCEQPGAKWKPISSETSQNIPVSLTGKYSAKRIFGKGILSNPNLQSGTGYGLALSNCLEQYNILLFMSTVNGQSETTTVNFLIEIDYIVIFFEKHNFAMNA